MTRIKKAGLTPKQETAVAVIIEAGTIEAAAARIGVSRTAIYNWLKEPAFKGRLEAERKAVFDEAVGLIKVATKQAAARLVNLMGNKNANLSRLAAKDILAFGIKSVEIKDLEERLDHIEELLAERGPRRKV